MSTPKHSASGAANLDLQTDIERTREQLGSTVDELAAKFDVKSRVEHSARDAKDRALRAAEPVTQNLDEEQLKRYGPPALGAMALLLMFLGLRRRRRAKKSRAEKSH